MFGNMRGGGPPGRGQHVMRGRGNMRMGPPNFHSGFQGPQGPPGMMNRGFRPRFPNNGPPWPGGVPSGFPSAGSENEGSPAFSVEDVLGWLEEQHPMAIHQIMYHCRYLLEQIGFPLDETTDPSAEVSSWYSAEASGPSPGMKRPLLSHRGGFDPKRGRGGYMPNNAPNNLQWTPGGWVPKDNPHKITTKMKPLPEPEIIPPSGGTNYPEAAADKDKLKMLTNNINMMKFELNKICKAFKIPYFDKEKISTYPEEAQAKLQTAVTCLEKAEQTLGEFRDFLRTEKYKEWNEKQIQDMEDNLKEPIEPTEDPDATNNTVRGIIGAMPKGQPHAHSKETKPDPPADLKEILGEMPVGVPFKSTQ